MEERRGGRGRFSGVCERQQETETMWKFDQSGMDGWRKSERFLGLNYKNKIRSMM